MLEWGGRKEAELNVTEMLDFRATFFFFLFHYPELAHPLLLIEHGNEEDFFTTCKYDHSTEKHLPLQAAICRCSQPLSGFYTRCIDDELLLEAIRQTNPGSQFLYVVDTRPKVSMYQNPL